MKDSRRLSSGLMLTEFGACMDPVLCPQEITRVTSHADDMQLSWIYWQYSNEQRAVQLPCLALTETPA